MFQRPSSGRRAASLRDALWLAACIPCVAAILFSLCALVGIIQVKPAGRAPIDGLPATPVKAERKA